MPDQPSVQTLPKKLKRLAIYIHVPFCQVRCGYCDFCAVSVGKVRDFGEETPTETKRPAKLQEFHRYIVRELEQHSELLKSSQISSVFFGGGTPSLLEPSQIASILHALSRLSSIAPGAEITLEANPDTLSYEYLAALRSSELAAAPLAQNGASAASTEKPQRDTSASEASTDVPAESCEHSEPQTAKTAPSTELPARTPTVNRISLGAQSFDAEVLKTLDRRHSVAHLESVFSAARALGFCTSIDLIYGTPGESMASWRKTIDSALALHPEHVSAYALTLEPETRLARRIAKGEILPVDEDFQAQEYVLLDECLTQAGYEWYEISNWALKSGASAASTEPNQNAAPENARAQRAPTSASTQSTHNLTYWENGEWLGLGPSAHSHLFTAAPREQSELLIAGSRASGEATNSEKSTRAPKSVSVANSDKYETPPNSDKYETPPNSDNQATSSDNQATNSDKQETRFWNTSNVSEYFARLDAGETPEEACEVITPEMQKLESAMLFARQNKLYKPPQVLPSTVGKLVQAGFVDAETKRLTIRGRMLNDQVVAVLESEKRCPFFNTMRCRACPICIMD